MSEQKQARAIGLFTLIALVIMVFGVSMFGSSSFFKKEVNFEMTFPGNIKGLIVGAPVTFRGVKVGEVSRIEFQQPDQLANQELNILVLAKFSEYDNGFPEMDEIEEFTRKQIDLGMAAKLVSGSFVTGTLQIQLEYYLKDSQEKYDQQSITGSIVVPTVPSDLQYVTEILSSVAEQFEQFPIQEILENVRELTASINSITSNDDINIMVQELSLSAASLRNIMENVDDKSVTLLQKADTFLDKGNLAVDSITQTSDEIKQFSVSGRTSLNQLNLTLAAATKTMLELEKQVKPSSALSISVIKTMSSVESAANQVRQLSQTLERNPEAIIGGRQR